MKIVLFIIDFLSSLFMITSITVFLGNYKQAVDGLPKFFQNKIFLLITGLCMFILIFIFTFGIIEWNKPVLQYEQVLEPLYRLKQ